MHRNTTYLSYTHHTDTACLSQVANTHTCTPTVTHHSSNFHKANCCAQKGHLTSFVSFTLHNRETIHHIPKQHNLILPSCTMVASDFSVRVVQRGWHRVERASGFISNTRLTYMQERVTPLQFCTHHWLTVVVAVMFTVITRLKRSIHVGRQNLIYHTPLHYKITYPEEDRHTRV